MMWATFAKLWSDPRWHAAVLGFILAALTQGLSLVSHKLGLDPTMADKIPGAANVLTLAIGAFISVYIGAHAHAEAGTNIGTGLAAGLQAAGTVIQSAVIPGGAPAPADPNTGTDAPAAPTAPPSPPARRSAL
jgi:MFS superfamily sulfate permease-like transporter